MKELDHKGLVSKQHQASHKSLFRTLLERNCEYAGWCETGVYEKKPRHLQGYQQETKVPVFPSK